MTPPALLLASALAWAEPQEPPVFPSEVSAVALDVTVLDERGRPATDLKPEDFLITVDGRARGVLFAQYLSEASAGEAARAPDPAERTVSNEGARRGRLVIIVVDQGNVRKGGGHAVARDVGRLLDRLTPADRVGLLTFPNGPRVELTRDQSLVREALKRVNGQGRFTAAGVGIVEALGADQWDPGSTIAWGEAIQRECPDSPPPPDPRELILCRATLENEARSLAAEVHQRSTGTLNMLRALFESLKSIDGPKTVILISEAWVPGVPTDVSSLASAAADAEVSLQVLVPDTPSVDVLDARLRVTAAESRQVQLRGLEGLASASRGALFREAPGGAGAVFDRIALELSGHYRLGFEPEPATRDGKTHGVRVAVRRKGLTVRARERVRLEGVGTSKQEPKEALARVLAAPFWATALPLRVTTYILKEAETSKVRVLIVPEIGRSATPPPGTSMAFVLLDGQKRVAADGFSDAHPPGRKTAPYVTAVVEPGTYHLKLAAMDGSGRKGSVEREVAARLTSSGDFEAADLMLSPGVLEAGSPSRPAPSAEVTADRLAAFGELYGRDAGKLGAAQVRLEVAEHEDDPPLLAAPAALGSLEKHRVPFRGLLPVGVLPPGHYVVRAQVFESGQPVGRLLAPLSLAPSGSGGSMRNRALSSFATRAAPFKRQDVLGAEVVGAFLKRLPPAASGPVAQAGEDARAGRFAAVLADLEAHGGEPLSRAFLKGVALLAQGERTRAEGQFREALRISSDFFPAAFYLGACDAEAGFDREAIGAWQTSLITESGVREIYAVLSDALLRLDDAGGAVDILEEAVRSWPEDLQFQRRLGLARAMKGLAPEALTVLEPYLRSHPEDVDVLFVVLRLLIDIEGSRGPGGIAAGDRARIEEYGRAYARLGGPQKNLVGLWLRYLARPAS